MQGKVRSVAIQGDGVAAYCCAHLLKAQGYRVILDRSARSRIPAILLSEASLALIRDIFGRPDLFRNLPKIQQRVVVWGDDSRNESAKRRMLEHSGVVVSEEFLVENLRQGIESEDSLALGQGDAKADWSICASQPLPASVTERRFGTRIASAVPVELRDGFDLRACWIESLEDGWLFLMPVAHARGWLLSVGRSAEFLLGRSVAIAGQIAQVHGVERAFPSSPRIVTPLCEPGWLACGTAAMAFDPICGDGTAYAIREAILASAVVGSALRGESVERLLSHYETRLTAGFQRHLEVCRQVYQSGHRGPWWSTQLESLGHGLEWCAGKTGGQPAFHYRLKGLELQTVG